MLRHSPIGALEREHLIDLIPHRGLRAIRAIARERPGSVGRGTGVPTRGGGCRVAGVICGRRAIVAIPGWASSTSSDPGRYPVPTRRPGMGRERRLRDLRGVAGR